MRDRADGVLHRRVAGAVRVRLDAGDGADVHDVAVARRFELRQQRARHQHQPEDVRLPHRAPVLVVRLRDRREAERAAGVVHQHVAPRHSRRERLDAGAVAHIERQRRRAQRLRHRPQPVEPPRPRDHVEPLVPQPPHRGCADAAAGAGDHCCAFGVCHVAPPWNRVLTTGVVSMQVLRCGSCGSW